MRVGREKRGWEKEDVGGWKNERWVAD